METDYEMGAIIKAGLGSADYAPATSFTAFKPSFLVSGRLMIVTDDCFPFTSLFLPSFLAYGVNGDHWPIALSTYTIKRGDDDKPYYYTDDR